MFPLRTVVAGTFVPTVLMEVGLAAVLPVVVASATSLGASLATAGILTALPAIGQIAADLPAGSIAARLGDRGTMMLAAVVAIVAFVLGGLAPDLVGLGAALVGMGASAAVFNLARHSYLTEITAPLQRGRVLTTLAGVHRFGAFLGPFLGAAVVAAGGVRVAYLMAAGFAAAALIVLLVIGPDERSPAARAAAKERRRQARAHGPSLWRVVRENLRVLATLGIAVVLVGAVRGARQTVLPLWGEHLGLDPATVSLVVGVAAAIDVVIFYPSGMVMDHFGRMWTGIPGTLGMGVALLLLPFTNSLGPFIAVALLLGAANGWSSGILMTLGADTAPEASRTKFLGAWRLLQDGGGALGPLVVGVLAGAVSLAVGIWAVAATGFGAASALGRWVPRWSVHATRSTRVAAGLPASPTARRRQRARRAERKSGTERGVDGARPEGDDRPAA